MWHVGGREVTTPPSGAGAGRNRAPLLSLNFASSVRMLTDRRGEEKKL